MPPKKDQQVNQGHANGNSEIEFNNADSTKNNGDSEQAKKKRKKVVIACVYCRRSHMICDDQRPCSRCIKRNIGHLCHDEPVSQRQKKKLDGSKGTPNQTVETASSNDNVTLDVETIPSNLQTQFSFGEKQHNQQDVQSQSNAGNSNQVNKSADPFFNFNQQPFFFSEHAGSEFSSLNEFLSMLDDPELINGDSNGSNSENNAAVLGLNSNTLFNTPPLNNNQQSSSLSASHSLTNLSLTNISVFNSPNLSSANLSSGQQFYQPQNQNQNNSSQQVSRSQLSHQLPPAASTSNIQQNISDSARDKFFLTAADPSTEISPEERLKQVINAKLEAGLLQPYNYARGYARLQAYMDNYMNQSSKQRILKPLSIFRPAFRAIARTLKDVDLILVEENFERMLLDYDRVFTSMAIPACLWRRTGEIYRGNKEFASLVEVSADDLKDGKLAIYELMSEESAVNFWEKYGAIAFDKGQKAVLTSCNLRTKDGRRRKTCCFSFTIRRDRYNIPSCIVGNFIPINP